VSKVSRKQNDLKTMDYKNRNVAKRVEESPLWESLSKQDGETLPYLLERYLLLENWRYLDRRECEESKDVGDLKYDISYLHLLLAECATVLLSQEERIRKLEDSANKNLKSERNQLS
jgi:hypothetical protein